MITRMIKKIVLEEKGSVLLLVAAGMMVFLGLTAMVVDVGRTEAKKFQLANTMDAAALAGAQDLPARTEAEKEKVINAAIAIAWENGEVVLNASDVQLLPAESEKKTKIRVDKSGSLETLFFRVLGDSYATMDFGAGAAAEVNPLSGGMYVIPAGLSLAEAEALKVPENVGDPFTIKVGSKEDDPLLGKSGWFGALTFNRSDGKQGATAYRINIEEGCDVIIRTGEVKLTETGNMAGPTDEGVQARIDKCKAGCTFEKHDLDCPRIMLVPIYDFMEDQDFTKQIKSVNIVGFASMWLEESELTGKNKTDEKCTITGRYLKTVIIGEAGGPSTPDYSTYTARLCE